MQQFFSSSPSFQKTIDAATQRNLLTIKYNKVSNLKEGRSGTISPFREHSHLQCLLTVFQVSGQCSLDTDNSVFYRANHRKILRQNHSALTTILFLSFTSRIANLTLTLIRFSAIYLCCQLQMRLMMRIATKRRFKQPINSQTHAKSQIDQEGCGAKQNKKIELLIKSFMTGINTKDREITISLQNELNINYF